MRLNELRWQDPPNCTRIFDWLATLTAHGIQAHLAPGNDAHQ